MGCNGPRMLSLKQPYASATVSSSKNWKNIENRTRVLFPLSDEHKDHRMKPYQRPQAIKINIVNFAKQLDNDLLRSEVFVRKVCSDAIEALYHQKNIQRVNGGIKELIVVGDLHGSYASLMKILDLLGNKIKTKSCHFVFNGDYVDRGDGQLSVLMLLAWLRSKYPDHVFLNRGNHEHETMNRKEYHHGRNFVEELEERAYDHLYEECFMSLFNAMPLATIWQDRVFIVHGGPPRPHELRQWESVDTIDRMNGDILQHMIFADMLWSDPTKEASITGWRKGKRGKGGLFSERYTKEFLKAVDCQLLVRSHQCVRGGCDWVHGRKVCTIFSAENYVGLENRGAVIVVKNCGDELKCNCVQF